MSRATPQDGQSLPPRVAVLTLTMNRIEYTKRMMDSMRRHTNVAFDHYIVDNGSTDGTQQYLEENAHLLAGLRLSPVNLGIDGGIRLGLDATGSAYDYVAKVDNDCEFIESDWLEALLDVCECFSRRIVVSPYVEGLGANSGGPERESHVRCAGHSVGLTKHVGGLCILAPARAYQDFCFKGRTLHGGTDEAFSIHVRLRLGYQMGYVEDVRVRHMDTTAGQQAKYPEYFRERQEIQRRTVPGERALTTRFLSPIRRLRELRLKRKAGLLGTPLVVYLLQRVMSRVSAPRDRADA